IHNRWPDKEVKDLPLTPEVIKAKGGQKGLDIYNAWVGHYDFERPIVAPPGVPKERIEILRKAYKAALHDPQFLAEAKKAKLAIRYVSPKEINEGVEKILGSSPEAKEGLGFLVRKKKKK
ncbi:MAG: hypothetical protein V3R58_00890, partial [candidate division NC10 bacterium]